MTYRFWRVSCNIPGSRYPALFIIPGAIALPFLAFRSTARLLRRFGRRILHQDAAALTLDPREWHEYCLEWHRDSVLFRVDGEMFCSPKFPVWASGIGHLD